MFESLNSQLHRNIIPKSLASEFISFFVGSTTTFIQKSIDDRENLIFNQDELKDLPSQNSSSKSEEIARNSLNRVLGLKLQDRHTIPGEMDAYDSEAGVRLEVKVLTSANDPQTTIDSKMRNHISKFMLNTNIFIWANLHPDVNRKMFRIIFKGSIIFKIFASTFNVAEASEIRKFIHDSRHWFTFSKLTPLESESHNNILELQRKKEQEEITKEIVSTYINNLENDKKDEEWVKMNNRVKFIESTLNRREDYIIVMKSLLLNTEFSSNEEEKEIQQKFETIICRYSSLAIHRFLTKRIVSSDLGIRVNAKPGTESKNEYEKYWNIIRKLYNLQETSVNGSLEDPRYSVVKKDDGTRLASISIEIGKRRYIRFRDLPLKSYPICDKFYVENREYLMRANRESENNSENLNYEPAVISHEIVRRNNVESDMEEILKLKSVDDIEPIEYSIKTGLSAGEMTIKNIPLLIVLRIAKSYKLRNEDSKSIPVDAGFKVDGIDVTIAIYRMYNERKRDKAYLKFTNLYESIFGLSLTTFDDKKIEYSSVKIVNQFDAYPETFAKDIANAILEDFKNSINLNSSIIIFHASNGKIYREKTIYSLLRDSKYVHHNTNRTSTEELRLTWERRNEILLNIGIENFQKIVQSGIVYKRSLKSTGRIVNENAFVLFNDLINRL